MPFAPAPTHPERSAQASLEAAGGVRRAVPTTDLIGPILELTRAQSAPRRVMRARLPAPKVVAAGDIAPSRFRARWRMHAVSAPAMPTRGIFTPHPAPKGATGPSAWLRLLRPAANDERVRIAVLSAILGLLLANLLGDAIQRRFETVIEVDPPTHPHNVIVERAPRFILPERRLAELRAQSARAAMRERSP